MSIEGITSLPRFCQARHSRHVSTIGLISASRTSSIPAAWRMVRIFGSRACHHRRCSFRSSRCTTDGSPDLKFRKLIWILKRVQSGNLAGPVPVLAYVRLTLDTVSGPLVPLSASGFAFPRSPKASGSAHLIGCSKPVDCSKLLQERRLSY